MVRISQATTTNQGQLQRTCYYTQKSTPNAPVGQKIDYQKFFDNNISLRDPYVPIPKTVTLFVQCKCPNECLEDNEICDHLIRF